MSLHGYSMGSLPGRIAQAGEEVLPFDFASIDYRSVEHESALSPSAEQLARKLAGVVSAYLRTTVEVNPSGIVQTNLEAFAEATSKAGCRSQVRFGSNPMVGYVFLEQTLVFPILEMLLGAASPMETIPERGLTEIERRLITNVLQLVGEEAGTCCGLGNPVVVEMPNEATVLGDSQTRLASYTSMNFAMTLGSFAGSCVVGLPLESKSRTVMVQDSADDPWILWRNEVARALLDTPVRIDAALPGVMVGAADLLSLQPGDMVITDQVVDQVLSLRINDTPCFTGQIVESAGQRAFGIRARVAWDE